MSVTDQKCYKCGTKLCMISANESDIKKADAVVFHHRNIDIRHLPKYRKQSQIWIFYTRVTIQL